MQADANDYVEKEFGAFYRCYPPRAATPSPTSGSASSGTPRRRRAERRSLRRVRQLLQPPGTGAPTWADWYQDSQSLEGKAPGRADHRRPVHDLLGHPVAAMRSSIRLSRTSTLDVPDQYRVDIWQQAFSQGEQTGNMANLNLAVGAGRPHRPAPRARRPLPGCAGRRQRPSRRTHRRRHLALASSGRTPRSSSSRTTRRTASITSTATARRSTSSARTPSPACQQHHTTHSSTW